MQNSTVTEADESKKSVLCFGAMHMDRLARCLYPFRQGISNPVESSYAVGGVAFNIARNLRLRHCNVGMVSCVGDDIDGRFVLEHAGEWQIATEFVETQEGQATATYAAILNPDGELAAGLSEMTIYESINIDRLQANLHDFQKWPIWVVDANLPEEAIDWLCVNKGNSQICVAPVSPSKVTRWQEAYKQSDIWIGNMTEASALSGLEVTDVRSAQKAALSLRAAGPEIVVLTMAAEGVVVSSIDGSGHWQIPPTDVVDVNGAGDSFFAGFIAEIAKSNDVKEAVLSGIAVASLTTESSGPVNHSLTDEVVTLRRSMIPDSDLSF